MPHTADLRLRVTAPTMESLLETSAMAMFQVMVDLDKVEERMERDIVVEAPSREDAVVGWLQEWLYRFQVDREVFRSFQARVEDRGKDGWRLTGHARGEALDSLRHEAAGREIKAVTYHNLRVDPGPPWSTEVVFDV